MKGFRFRPNLATMDDRLVPTATVLSQVTHSWSGPTGSATVQVTVTDEGDGEFEWDYSITSGMGTLGQPATYLGLFVVPIPSSDDVLDQSNSAGWNEVVGYSNVINGEAVSWSATEEGGGIPPGGGIDFSFTTPP